MAINDGRVMICDKCRFPQDALVHLSSIAGEAACENQVFRPLMPGEIPRKVTWQRGTEIAVTLILAIAFMVFIVWLGSLKN